jgi:hypothetical protein
VEESSRASNISDGGSDTTDGVPRGLSVTDLPSVASEESGESESTSSSSGELTTGLTPARPKRVTTQESREDRGDLISSPVNTELKDVLPTIPDKMSTGPIVGTEQNNLNDSVTSISSSGLIAGVVSAVRSAVGYNTTTSSSAELPMAESTLGVATAASGAQSPAKETAPLEVVGESDSVVSTARKRAAGADTSPSANKPRAKSTTKTVRFPQGELVSKGRGRTGTKGKAKIDEKGSKKRNSHKAGSAV